MSLATLGSSSTRRLGSFQLMTQAAPPELTLEQLMTQVDYPGINSDWLMTRNISQFFDSNQLMTQAKTFDSESTHDSTQSHTHVYLRGLSTRHIPLKIGLKRDPRKKRFYILVVILRTVLKSAQTSYGPKITLQTNFQANLKHEGGPRWSFNREIVHMQFGTNGLSFEPTEVMWGHRRCVLCFCL